MPTLVLRLRRPPITAPGTRVPVGINSGTFKRRDGDGVPKRGNRRRSIVAIELIELLKTQAGN